MLAVISPVWLQMTLHHGCPSLSVTTSHVLAEKTLLRHQLLPAAGAGTTHSSLEGQTEGGPCPLWMVVNYRVTANKLCRQCK